MADYATQNYPFSRIHLEVETLRHYTNKPTNLNSKCPKLLRQRIRKRYYKTLGTSLLKI